MLLILRSTALSCASTSAFPVLGASVMDDAPEPVPVVVAPPDGTPLEFAVPVELVPGGGGDATLDALPTPLGSLTGLLRPPALAGPDGTPLIADVPAPAEPAALGEPAAEPVPADAPLAAPPALCANALMGSIMMVAATSVAGIESLLIEISLRFQREMQAPVPSRNKFAPLQLNVGLGYAGASGGAAHA
jgi:hypothetical protein